MLGHVTGSPGGPVLVVVGALHGNEPAGIGAIRRVLATVFERQLQLRGQLVALAGNLAALTVGKRYLAHDLNRLWLADRIGALRRRQPGQIDSEDREQLALIAEFERLAEATGRAGHVLDLHTTSGDGFPFAVASDTLANRDFAAAFPVPVILGLEEALEGTMLDHLGAAGWTTFAFEGGQHEDPLSVDCAEAAIWIAMESTGILDPADRAFADAARATLQRRTAGLPQVFEVCHHHRIRHGDAYVTEPGYASFQPISKNQLVARDRNGEVRSPHDGRILMPLYQALGDDGYFVIREFSRFWLLVSRVLRRLGLDRRVTLLPGIHAVPGHAEMIAIDLRVARWLAPQLLRLLGYRRSHPSDSALVLSRRPDRTDAGVA